MARSIKPREPEAAAAVDDTRLDEIRVLVVDDEPDAREVVSFLLEDRGAAVQTAASAEEARSVVARLVPHVIVSDIGMPREDGYSFIQSIRALPHAKGGAVPAVALTAFTSPEDRRRALNAGFNKHLGKPVDPDELLSVVRALANLPREDDAA